MVDQSMVHGGMVIFGCVRVDGLVAGWLVNSGWLIKTMDYGPWTMDYDPRSGRNRINTGSRNILSGVIFE